MLRQLQDLWSPLSRLAAGSLIESQYLSDNLFDFDVLRRTHNLVTILADIFVIGTITGLL